MIYLFTSSQPTINFHYFWCSGNSEYYRIIHNTVAIDKWYHMYYNDDIEWARVGTDDVHIHKLIIPTNLNIIETEWFVPDISICHQKLEKIIFDKLL